MNPLDSSPAAQAFWASIIRHLLAGIAGVLVTHGYVTQTGANAYIEELVGVALYGAGQVWSNRAAYIARVKMLTALWMPRGTTEQEVDAHLAARLPTPDVSTPPNTVPGVPKLVWLLPLLLVAALAGSSCASFRPPATVITPAGQMAYTADQVVVRVNELMNAAIAANAQNALPATTTRTIVRWCVAADQTLAQTPAGWQATVLAGWKATKAQLPPITNPAIVAAMGAVDVVVGDL